MKSYLLFSILFYLATLLVNASEEIIVPVKEILDNFGYQSSTEHPEHKTTYGFKKGDK